MRQNSRPTNHADNVSHIRNQETIASQNIKDVTIDNISFKILII